MRRHSSYLRVLVAAVIAVAVGACASMGRPEGGPRDETPPVFMRSNPMPGSTEVTRNRIEIMFDENVKLDDPMNKIVFSPAQKDMPKVTAVGRKITVNFQDTLIPNTTYTIDFTDAIRDNNEGNPLDGFSIDFATGKELDSLCISGMVFQAENLEPAQSMLVGVHSNLSDTAITSLPFERLTKTNQLGQFTIRNLKEGSYRIYAINDKNRDNRWDRSEDIAFYDAVITPTAARVSRSDTLKNAAGEDSIVTRQVTEFGPKDILLTWFNENYKPQYLKKYERTDAHKLHIEFGAPSDTFPELRFVGGPHNGELFSDYSVLAASATRDTLDYWIADSATIVTDSLFLSARFLRTDTLDQLVWGTDTLKFILKSTKKKEKEKELERKEKERLKKEKEREKERGELLKQGKEIPAELMDSVTDEEEKVEFLTLKPSVSGTVDVFADISITASEPIWRWDTAAFHMEIQRDTLWEETAAPVFTMSDSLKPLELRAPYTWEPGAKYRLSVDSLGVRGIYDVHNKPEKSEFTVRKLEEYSNIAFNISNLYGPAVVEMLSAQDKPVRIVRATPAGRAEFRNLMPGNYYVRLYIDRDSSGTYTNGLLRDSLQPEDVFYYPKKLSLKKNWDIEQSWDIFETPVEQQKPADIKKNKPKKNTGDDGYGDGEDDDQYYDEFGNPSVDPDDPFGKRKGRNYNRGRNNNTGNGRNGLGGLGGGGLQRAGGF